MQRKLDYYSPDDLKIEIAAFVDYYNHERYHESLKNVTPADVYTGRHVKIIERRDRIKEQTLKLRKRNYKKAIDRAQSMA